MTASGFVFRKAKRLLGEVAALAVLTSLASFAAAQPKPTLEYIFDKSKDNLTTFGGIIDHSGNKFNGTELSGGTETSFVPGHLSGTTAVLFLGDDDPNSSSGEPGVGTAIDTGALTSDVKMDNQSWTVMAWINRTCFKEDQMVFGSGAGSGSYLHLGFRRGLAYFGTWNGDSSAYVGNLVGVYEWHHYALRYDAVKKTHSIFVDGAPILNEPGAVFPGYGTNLLIGGNYGYAGNGAGCFAGAIEHPRVYGGQALRDDQIAADSNDNPIPP
ncbi:MAG TPA: LamG-like jellyroll fold domain-containing protein [Gemmataceae bacterium]|nr:LamG-like jellyroll fold domain-containing protein [Gemmataceae bacterium]